ncbi:MAG: restriction endonuclease, partial [Muribaculaceae bacterium]|nr:restriction endonuclease [Muribaculaceae bacterium]
MNSKDVLSLNECTRIVADAFGLTPEERAVHLKKGNQTLIKNRTGWAKFYLEKAGLVTTVSKGTYRLTDAGRTLLREYHGPIDLSFLITIPQFAEFYNPEKFGKMREDATTPECEEKNSTPDEILEEQYALINQNLADEILQKVREMSPAFFERLVITLLEAMGYGHGVVTGRTGDEGIDGIIGEDKLGLDVIHIQAKRWSAGNNVGRRELQSFVGALAGQSGRKGVFITTSSFTKEALEYNPANVKIARIDGNKLAHLMIEH